jgi:hypothetical protein
MEGYRGMDPFIELSHHAHANCIFYATREPLMQPGSRPSGGKIPFNL